METSELQAGKNQLTWNAESLAQGVYFCRLKSGAKFMIKKVVKLN
jgi:hypothetical protein